MASAERLPAKLLPRKRVSCCAKREWPQSPDRRSSVPAAARTCCAIASPSRMRSWTRPASGCGSSEGARLVCFDPSASWTYIPGCAAIQDFKFGSCNLRNSTHSSMCSRECFSATSAAATVCVGEEVLHVVVSFGGTEAAGVTDHDGTRIRGQLRVNLVPVRLDELPCLIAVLRNLQSDGEEDAASWLRTLLETA